jgi:hypothetical protein
MPGIGMPCLQVGAWPQVATQLRRMGMQRLQFRTLDLPHGDVAITGCAWDLPYELQQLHCSPPNLIGQDKRLESLLHLLAGLFKVDAHAGCPFVQHTVLKAPEGTFFSGVEPAVVFPGGKIPDDLEKVFDRTLGLGLSDTAPAGGVVRAHLLGRPLQDLQGLLEPRSGGQRPDSLVISLFYRNKESAVMGLHPVISGHLTI